MRVIYLANYTFFPLLYSLPRGEFAMKPFCVSHLPPLRLGQPRKLQNSRITVLSLRIRPHMVTNSSKEHQPQGHYQLLIQRTINLSINIIHSPRPLHIAPISLLLQSQSRSLRFPGINFCRKSVLLYPEKPAIARYRCAYFLFVLFSFSTKHQTHSLKILVKHCWKAMAGQTWKQKNPKKNPPFLQNSNLVGCELPVFTVHVCFQLPDGESQFVQTVGQIQSCHARSIWPQREVAIAVDALGVLKHRIFSAIIFSIQSPAPSLTI